MQMAGLLMHLVAKRHKILLCISILALQNWWLSTNQQKVCLEWKEAASWCKLEAAQWRSALCYLQKLNFPLPLTWINWSSLLSMSRRAKTLASDICTTSAAVSNSFWFCSFKKRTSRRSSLFVRSPLRYFRTIISIMLKISSLADVPNASASCYSSTYWHSISYQRINHQSHCKSISHVVLSFWVYHPVTLLSIAKIFSKDKKFINISSSTSRWTASITQ